MNGNTQQTYCIVRQRFSSYETSGSTFVLGHKSQPKAWCCGTVHFGAGNQTVDRRCFWGAAQINTTTDTISHTNVHSNTHTHSSMSFSHMWIACTASLCAL